MKKIFLIIITALLLVGCPGSPVWKASQYVPPEANIKIVSHPKLIDGLEFVDGFSMELPGTFSTEDNENLVRYSVYERGHRDVTVLIEVKEHGDGGTWVSDANGGGSLVGVEDGWALITICKSK